MLTRRTPGRTDSLTDGQPENIMPPTHLSVGRGIKHVPRKPVMPAQQADLPRLQVMLICHIEYTSVPENCSSNIFYVVFNKFYQFLYSFSRLYHYFSLPGRLHACPFFKS